MLGIKSVVVHSQGKTVNPQWKITDNLLLWLLVNMTKLIHLGSHKQDIRVGSTN
jgi:hypothetical protein